MHIEQQGLTIQWDWAGGLVKDITGTVVPVYPGKTHIRKMCIC